MYLENTETVKIDKRPWNKGKLVGQKLALKQKQIWQFESG